MERVIYTGDWEDNEIKNGKIEYYGKDTGQIKFIGSYDGKIQNWVKNDESGVFAEESFKYKGQFKNDNLGKG